MGLDRAIRIGLCIHEIGNSQGVTVPKEWRDRLDVDPDDLVDAELDLEEGTVTYHF